MILSLTFNASHMFSFACRNPTSGVQYVRGNAKTQQPPIILDLCLSRKGQSQDYHDRHRFQNVFRPHKSELSRRFQIPPDFRTFSGINLGGRPNGRNAYPNTCVFLRTRPMPKLRFQNSSGSVDAVSDYTL